MENNILWIRAGVLLLYAGFEAWRDLRTRSISLPGSAIAALAGIVLLAADGGSAEILELAKPADTWRIWQCFYPLIPGLLLAAVSRITGGCVGLGDAVFLLVTGVYFRWEEVVIVLMSAWLLCAVWGLGILVYRHWVQKRSTEGDGVPFVTLAFPAIVMITAGWIG